MVEETAVLGSLVPLARLVEESGIPMDSALADVTSGDPARLVGRFDAPDVARDCLVHAGILGPSGGFTPRAEMLMFATFAIAVASSYERRWKPVLTVPAYLRPYLPEEGYSETVVVLRRLIRQARQRLLLAAPFMDDGIAALVPAIAAHVNNGGECLLVTRDIVDTGDRGRNRKIVDELRKQVRRRDALRISWWGGDNLGIHLKVVIADNEAAYVGSANFTRAGLGEHFEVGVLLEGAGVDELADLVTKAADGLDATHVWQAR